MKIYIAGPYTKPDPETNTKTAIAVGDVIARLGHIVFVPHLTHYWELQHHHDYDFWMAQDAAWLRCCDALLRLPGESAGADSEVELAYALGLKVYYSVLDIPQVCHE